LKFLQPHALILDQNAPRMVWWCRVVSKFNYTDPPTLFATDQTHRQNPYMSRLNKQVYDQTKSADLSDTWADPIGFCRRSGCGPGSPKKSGRIRLVEFGHKSALWYCELTWCCSQSKSGCRRDTELMNNIRDRQLLSLLQEDPQPSIPSDYIFSNFDWNITVVGNLLWTPDACTVFFTTLQLYTLNRNNLLARLSLSSHCIPTKLK